MENSQKERVERELMFLKGSFDAGIISREEYEKGVQRIERKKKELEEEGKFEEAKPEPKISEKAAEEITIKEIKEEVPEKEEETTSVEEETKSEKIEIEETEEKEQDVEEWIEKNGDEEKTEEKKPIKVNKKLIWAIALVAIVIIFINIFQANKDIPEINESLEITEPVVEEVVEELVPECYSDSDCREEGKIGVCNDPGTEDASCESIEPVEVSLTVISDKNCVSCDFSRMFGVIRDLFPGVVVNSLEYDSVKGKGLISLYNIDALPAYIFGPEVNNTRRYDEFKQALIKKRGYYLIRNSASGANYYFKRQKSPNRLELFTLSEETPDLDKSLTGVKDLFKNKIHFFKTLVDEDKKENLKKELGITTYPVFLVNNQLKFGGIQPPETIKNKFCELNQLDECSTTLSTVIP